MQNVAGYRAMPVIVDNPEWWVVEIMDGFGAHTISYKANKIRLDNKVLSLKEEGDSSSINQAYDKYVAKSDKHIQRINLNYLKACTQFNCNIPDQWGLLHCGLAAVRHTSRTPILWINSFIAVNLLPSNQLSFEDWCKRIKPFMKASDSFDLITQNEVEVDLYLLLPSLWQAMSTVDKTEAVRIVQEHDGNAWDVACCRQLVDALKVSLSDLPLLQPAIFLAIEDPSHLARGFEDAAMDEDGRTVSEDAKRIVEVEAGRVNANA